jgi:glycosyltransferase involved in cell wall biosynthesis
MKPLLVNTYDQTGGAARAAFRLMHALRQEHVAARLLVRKKNSQDENVLRGEASWLGWCRGYLDFLPLKLYPQRHTGTFSPASVPDILQRCVARMGPDLLHLHWVGDGFLKIETLQSLNIPLIWTMHDSWAFTGGCHLPADCKKYETSCGACPVLGSQAEKDLSRRVWDRKRRNYPLKEMTFISPSLWLAEQARASSLLRNCHIEVIPNGVDCSVYSPGDKMAARSACGLPEDREIILFGARHAFSDFNKGVDLLWETLGKLPIELRRKCQLVIFGEQKDNFVPPVEIETLNYGVIDDEAEIANLYRAADLFLMTSRQENLPNMVSEAMSSGLPCVAFAVGGIPEQISHRENGCLVDPFDTDAMSSEVSWLLSAKVEHLAMGRKAREFAQDRYSLQKVASQHIVLYEKVLNAAHDVGTALFSTGG